MVYAITYDLNTTGQDYSSLYKQINSLGETIRPLQNLWLLSTNLDVDTVRESIRNVIDSNDYVFITKLIRGNYSAWMLETAHNWLDSRL